MTTCNLCGEQIPADEIVDHLRVMHPDATDGEIREGLVEEIDGMQVAQITIRRLLTDDDIVDHVEAVDGDGEDLPLTKALGMLRLAEDTLIRERMGDEEQR